MAKINQETEQTAKASTKANKKTLTGELIMDPREEDILCGKEKHCVSHPGSLNFRAVIDKYASKYQEAITKQEKMNVTKEIYDNLGAQNSRFLKYNAKAKGWEELSSLLARDKISHALRFANREKKSPSKPKSKKGHRRGGSGDSSASDTTLTTVATELSQEDFDFLMDDEPLDFLNGDGATSDDSKPYVYQVPFEQGAPSPAPYYPAPQPYYHPHHHHQPSYGHHHHHPAYYHPQSYHHPQHHHSSYHHHAPHYPQAPVPAPQPLQYEETPPIESFPEQPLTTPLAKETSMDVDLTYMMSEPLMEWDMETDQVFVVIDEQ